DNSTRYIVFGRTSTTAPSSLMASSWAMSESPVRMPSPTPYAQNGRTVNHLASPLSSHHLILLPPPRPCLPSVQWRGSSPAATSGSPCCPHSSESAALRALTGGRRGRQTRGRR